MICHATVCYAQFSWVLIMLIIINISNDDDDDYYYYKGGDYSDAVAPVTLPGPVH